MVVSITAKGVFALAGINDPVFTNSVLPLLGAGATVNDELSGLSQVGELEFWGFGFWVLGFGVLGSSWDSTSFDHSVRIPTVFGKV